MKNYIGMTEAYYDLFEQVKINGISYGPRQKKCIEVRPTSFSLQFPEQGLYLGKSRRLNYRFLAIETLSYIAGWYDEKHAELIIAANSGMQFALNEKTKKFDGAYGKLLSIDNVITALQNDTDTRQAVVSIWAPSTLTDFINSKDTPCTCCLHFFNERLKNNYNMLSLSVYMRSNDLNWGTPYDVAAFCAIQMSVANTLGLPLGRYYHNCGSLHYYEDGNSQGEKPPTILPLIQESFISTLSLPRHEESFTPKDRLWLNKQINAKLILYELYEHRILQGGKWSEFKLDSTSKWVQGWVKMINFQHEKVEIQ